MDPVETRARERLERYLDLVERWGLCPWAAPARRDGSLVVAIVRTGEPAAIAAVLPRWESGARIALVVLPDAGLDPTALRRVRDRLTAAHPALAIADFHPDGGDLARATESPALLVPILRRSPDPMLQVVPLAELAAVAAPPPVRAPADQAALLAGHGAPAPLDPRAKIAEHNFATVRARLAELVAELAALRA